MQSSYQQMTDTKNRKTTVSKMKLNPHETIELRKGLYFVNLVFSTSFVRYTSKQNKQFKGRNI